MIGEKTLTNYSASSTDADYSAFCRLVLRGTGLDLASYKRNQMERRLLAMAERVGARTLQEYWRIVSKDPSSLRSFLDRITINVSELFRNAEKFEELKRDIFPELLQRSKELRVWSAGCSYGAEAYSLKIILHQLTPNINHRILATDIDNGILERARKAWFSEEDMKNVPEALRRKYFQPSENGYRVQTAFHHGVEFKQHNLLRDTFPEGQDLILCRNVVIYFSDEAKQTLFERFTNALKPGGYLLLGSTERIIDAAGMGLKSPRPFFYQRIDNQKLR